MTDAPDVERSEEGAGPGRRRLRLVLGGIGAVALIAVLFVPKSSGDGSGERAAPPFELPSVVDPDRTVSLAQFRGTPVVLNFWASWCVPCRKEMPTFQAVAERLDGKVAFVGVNHQDGRSGARDLLEESGVRYPAAYDPKGSVARSFGLFGMPTTVFITAEGRVVKKRTGELSQSELEDTIREVLGVTVPRQ